MCAAIFAQVVLIIVFITNKEEVSFYLRIEIFRNFGILKFIGATTGGLYPMQIRLDLRRTKSAGYSSSSLSISMTVFLSVNQMIVSVCFETSNNQGENRHIRYLHQQTSTLWRRKFHSKCYGTIRLSSKSG